MFLAELLGHFEDGWREVFGLGVEPHSGHGEHAGRVRQAGQQAGQVAEVAVSPRGVRGRPPLRHQLPERGPREASLHDGATPEPAGHQEGAEGLTREREGLPQMTRCPPQSTQGGEYPTEVSLHGGAPSEPAGHQEGAEGAHEGAPVFRR